MLDAFPRRDFLRLSLAGTVAGCFSRPLWAEPERPSFQISLNELSLRESLETNQLTHLDFAAVAKRDFGIEAVDYASEFFASKTADERYWAEMNKRAADAGVRQLLILVRSEKRLGADDPDGHKQAVEEHRRWIDAAQALGCHGICAAVSGSGTYEEQRKQVSESLSELCEYGRRHKINVLIGNIGNNGDLSSNPDWLLDVVKSVEAQNCGVLPAFSGFSTHDSYKGMQRLIPVAKGICATARRFDDTGNETRIDYARMMKIVLQADYRGYVSVLYEGSRHSEAGGIRATKTLLERIRSES